MLFQETSIEKYLYDKKIEKDTNSNKWWSDAATPCGSKERKRELRRAVAVAVYLGWQLVSYGACRLRCSFALK